MTAITKPDPYGALNEPATLTMQRLLPGPVERVWSYLVQDDLRRQWLAAGAMEERLGATFALTWRNDELTDPPGPKPEGFGAEHSMDSEVTAIEPLRLLAFTWGSTGGVSFELEPQGDQVLLTLTHRRVIDPAMLRNVSAGWHAHLDILADRLAGDVPAPFWDSWARLHADYGERYSA